MSAEYVVKMEALRRNREELTTQRKEIERRIALREATAAEYSAIALQSTKQKWKSLRASALAAKKRNDEFIREIHETQRKVDEVYVRTTQKLWPSDNQLELEKARYMKKVEELYPAWQEKMQVVRIQTLRELEQKKCAIEKRRYLAKKTFETEQTLDDLIQQTSHEIGLAENLEKNEAFERDVLRSQSAVQAARLDVSIREHAAGARMYMQQQAYEQLTTAQNVQSDVEDQLFQTFSPRRAITAMRDANAAIAIVQSVDNNAEESSQRPLRTLSISTPTTQFRVRSEDPLPDPYVNTQIPSNDPVASARAWARSGLPTGDGKSTFTPQTYVVKPDDTSRIRSNNHEPQAPHSKELMTVASRAHPQENDSTSTPVVRNRETPSTEASGVPSLIPELASAFPKLTTNSTVHPVTLSSSDHSIQRVESGMALQNEPTVYEDEKDLAALREGFTVLAAATNGPVIQSHSQQVLTQPSAHGESGAIDSLYKAEQGKSEEQIGIVLHEARNEFVPAPMSTVKEVNLSLSEPYTLPTTLPYETYKLVDIKQPESHLTAFKEEERKDGYPIDCQLSPPRNDDVHDPADLSLNLVNSFDSNQSSIMDFSVGKLLQTPIKLDGEPQSDRTDGPTRSAPNISTAKTLVLLDEEQSLPEPDAAERSQKDNLSNPSSSRTGPFEKKPFTASVSLTSTTSDTRSSSFGLRHDLGEVAANHKPNAETSGVISSLESTSGLDSPVTKLPDDPMLESISDLGSPLPAKDYLAQQNDLRTTTVSPSSSLVKEDSPRHAPTSLFASMSMPDKFKALTALIARVEEGVSDGEQFSPSAGSESTQDTKRDLARMAASGRKAQINFFGSDVCFELIVDLARDLGPVLLPAKAFEGILSDQKMKKVHQNGKEKELDMWKAFSALIKQLHTTKAVSVSALVDQFTSAFLDYDPTNQRSQRKLRELLFSICGATDSTPAKATTPVSPQQTTQVQDLASSRVPTETPTSPQVPTLLQTAFLHATSPPAAPKTYGLAFSSFKKKSNSDDILKSMASSPTKLSQKLMRGGKMGDYSEFEEEDEVDLGNLIGSKPSKASTTTTALKSGSRSRGDGPSSARLGGVREDKDDFDVDF